ncbi:hypothetical protein G8759_03230 [Spirosoma aureum]|uniref:Uncharacterized protein n=1 Tax=Spirosoma aureum TaxID=2692134 RepID=A0A6G9AHC0_9BACT|nr:hypothetical protein [Spirosoma aureum]QIP11709.1 hypothetical protein G8759_03230 [Spirosoma aureum]
MSSLPVECLYRINGIIGQLDLFVIRPFSSQNPAGLPGNPVHATPAPAGTL